jgi:plasmid replication initiation protein
MCLINFEQFKVFKNKLLTITVTQTNIHTDQFQQEPTKKKKHSKGVLWSLANRRKMFIDITNMILGLALP